LTADKKAEGYNMYGWLAFKELFVCMAVIAVVGMTLSIWVMHDRYDVRERVYAASYEPLKGFRETGQLQDDNRPGINSTVAAKDIGD
jgi:hypothetical protein